jgi:hypothetical protein
VLWSGREDRGTEMATRSYETTGAFRELLEVIGAADRTFLEGARALPDDVSVLEGYRWLTEVLGVALDCHVWADPARPSFVQIVGPTRKFGGDDADACYSFAPLDPERTYRVYGRMGDACYLSLCVYGGPTDGRWANRIVSTIHDGEIDLGPDRSFEISIGAEAPAAGGRNWLKIESDAVCILTRDYLLDPGNGARASYRIEALEVSPPPPPLSDVDLARRLRCAATFVRDLLKICPISTPLEPNTVGEPYPQPLVSYGWFAPDAVHALGRWELADDEALVIEGRSPRCRFWNLCLWNPFLQTYDYRYERVTINGGQVTHEADGSWRLVVAKRDPVVKNWISTAGHDRGLVWFRWFLAETVPARPLTRVVKLADLRD